ncbi:MAG: hypothetical protein AAFV95_13180 [Bacteroidota bacterium]
MRPVILLAFFLTQSYLLSAQYVTGMATRWSDSFVEWNIYYVQGVEEDEEEQTGELKMKWPLRNDWTEWTYDFADTWGDVRLVWKNDPSRWQIISGAETVTMRRLWKEDDREWRITDNTVSLTLRTRYGNDRNEWEVRETTYGTFQMRTSYREDPRDWMVDDFLNEEVSITMRMALVFLVTYNSVPKF